MQRSAVLTLCAGMALGSKWARAEESAPADAGATSPAWCASELDALSDGICAFVPEHDAAKHTLVIFLHGVIKDGTTWQWTQERAIVRGAKRHHFSVLVPRGRRGIGPKGMEDFWTWPTSVKNQKLLEQELVDEWTAAKADLEAKNGTKFDRTYVFGFSNGAYYATSLALRARLPVNGYAVFAGGAGAKWLTGPAGGASRRAPIYVGYGLKDKSHKDPKGLGKALKRLGWPHKVRARKNVGHSMPDAGVAEALQFLSQH